MFGVQQRTIVLHENLKKIKFMISKRPLAIYRYR